MPVRELSGLFGSMDAAGQHAQEQFDRERDADLQMYQQELLKPPAEGESPEAYVQRKQKIADQIAKLRQMKGKDTPYHTVANLLGHLGAAHLQKQQGGARNNPEEIPSGVGPTANLGIGKLLTPEQRESRPDAPTPSPEASPTSQPQKKLHSLTAGLGNAALQVPRALGKMMTALEPALIGTPPQTTADLPPIDPTLVTPTGGTGKPLGSTPRPMGNGKYGIPFELPSGHIELREVPGYQPTNKMQEQISQMEEVLGRPLTDAEIKQKFHLNPTTQHFESVIPDPDSSTGFSKAEYDLSGKELARVPYAGGSLGTETQHTSSTDVNPETGASTTTSTTRKVPAGSAAPSAKPPTRSLTHPTQGKSAAGGTSTIAQEAKDWAERGVKPPAKNEYRVRAYMAANNLRPQPATTYRDAMKEVTKAQSDYEGAQVRMETMDKNLTAALQGDQQAMLSLVANHIGMTLGAQKGARITRAVWEEAIESAPWMSRVTARWSGDGYLLGVALTPEQMQQMVNLGHEKVDILKRNVQRVKEDNADILGTATDPPPKNLTRPDAGTGPQTPIVVDPKDMK